MAAGRRSLAVAWAAAPANGRPVSSYLVAAGGRRVVVQPGALRARLNGLRPRAKVRVTVRARNAMGWGPATVSQVVRPRR